MNFKEIVHNPRYNFSAQSEIICLQAAKKKYNKPSSLFIDPLSTKTIHNHKGHTVFIRSDEDSTVILYACDTILQGKELHIDDMYRTNDYGARIFF